MVLNLGALTGIGLDAGLLLVRLSLIAILTLFVLLSGFLLPMYLRGLQQQELQRIKSVFSAIQHTAAFTAADSAAPTFNVFDYLTPVLFTAFIVFIFAAIAMFGARAPALPDFILGGTQLFNGDAGDKAGVTFLRTYEEGTLSMIVFAFFGSFIWSLQYILGRVMTRDISPGEFYKIALNMIFAIILAVAFRHSLSAIFGGELLHTVLESALPTLGFLIGLFPNFFLEWLVKQVQAKWFGTETRSDPLDLKQIEGLSDFAIFRLKDLDIYNAQNLAFANPVTLYMRTRFGLTEAVDWVGQAQLLILFKFAQTTLLRDLNIRTIPDLAGCVTREPVGSPVLASLASALGSSVERIRALALCLEDDPAYVRLRELRYALAVPADARLSEAS